MAIAQVSLAELVAVQHNYGEAERLFHDSHELYRQINDPGGQVRALIGLGDIAQARGDRTRAGSYFCTGLELAIVIGSLPLLLLQFTPIGELLASAGEPTLAIAAWMLVTQHATGERAMQRRTQADLRRAAAWKTAPLKGQAEGKAGADPFAMAALLRDKLVALKNQMPQSHAAVPPRLPTALPHVEPLSEREVEILRLIANGMTNQQIADRLHVVVGTVKVHNHHIFGKLGVSNRVGALARARELNLLS
jgi:DNA-binding CsgD family transcriptional regulator